MGKDNKENLARQQANKKTAPVVDIGTRAERRAAREGTGAEVKHILIKSMGRSVDPHRSYLAWTTGQPIPEGYAAVLDAGYAIRGFRSPSNALEAQGLAGHFNNEVVRERNIRGGKQPHEGVRASTLSLAMMKSLRLPPTFVQPKATSTQIQINIPKPVIVESADQRAQIQTVQG